MGQREMGLGQRWRLRRLARLVGAEAVAAEEKTFGHGADGGVDRHVRQGKGERTGVCFGGEFGHASGGHAQAFDLEAGRIAQTDEEDAARADTAERVHGEDGLGFGREVFLRGGV